MTIKKTIRRVKESSQQEIQADNKHSEATKKVQALYEQKPEAIVYTKRYQHLKKTGEQ